MKLDLNACRLRQMPVVAIAATGPYEVTIQETWDHLRSLLLELNLRDTCKPVFALLRDMQDEARPELRRLELCAAVNDMARRKLEGRAAIRTFAGGGYLTMRHRGPYTSLPEVFSRMHAACSLDMTVALDLARPRIICFHGDPADRPADELYAELAMPVVLQAAAETPQRSPAVRVPEPA